LGAFLKDAFDLIVEAIENFKTGWKFGFAVTEFESFRDFFSQGAGVLGATLDRIVDSFQNLWGEFKNNGGNIDGVLQGFLLLTSPLALLARDLVPALIEAAQPLIPILINLANDLFP